MCQKLSDFVVGLLGDPRPYVSYPRKLALCAIPRLWRDAGLRDCGIIFFRYLKALWEFFMVVNVLSCFNCCSKITKMRLCKRGDAKCLIPIQTPVPLSIFGSNSKFDENSKHSSVTYTQPITTTFCTRHDSVTVVKCAKYRCNRSSIFETRAFWIFIEFRIRSKYA